MKRVLYLIVLVLVFAGAVSADSVLEMPPWGTYYSTGEYADHYPGDTDYDEVTGLKTLQRDDSIRYTFEIGENFLRADFNGFSISSRDRDDWFGYSDAGIIMVLAGTFMQLGKYVDHEDVVLLIFTPQLDGFREIPLKRFSVGPGR